MKLGVREFLMSSVSTQVAVGYSIKGIITRMMRTFWVPQERDKMKWFSPPVKDLAARAKQCGCYNLAKGKPTLQDLSAAILKYSLPELDKEVSASTYCFAMC